MLGVLADQGDRNLVLGVAEPVQDFMPLLQIGRPGLDAEPPQDDVIDPVRLQRQWHLVDREILVALLDHGVERHVAEQGDLLPVGDVDRPLGAADEDVGLNADLAEEPDGVLRRLGLQFARRLEVGHEREVDEDAVLAAHLQRNLPDRLEEGEALDVAHGAADLGDGDVGLTVGEVSHHLLDLVGDVRNHLHGLAEKLSPPLLVDHGEVDLAGGVVALPRELGGGEPLVVTEVEVGLAPVVEHIHLAVLVRAHRARVDVDVRIEFLHPHPQAAGFEEHAHRGAREPLPQ